MRASQTTPTIAGLLAQLLAPAPIPEPRGGRLHLISGGTVAARIEAALSPSWRTRGEIAEEAKVAESSVDRVCNELLKTGKVLKSGTKWRLKHG